MPGIAGIFAAGKQKQVNQMLDGIAHRGRDGRAVFELANATLGTVWTGTSCSDATARMTGVEDHIDDGHFARAQVVNGQPRLVRDPFGAAPLYCGRTEDGLLCFGSEIKAILKVTHDVKAIPPGHAYDGKRLDCYFQLQPQPLLSDSPGQISKELHRRLVHAIEKCIRHDVMSAWLSGGLDSSTLAALARPHLRELHTFAAGMPGAPDLEYAREVAAFIDSTHHEIVVTFEEMIKLLPRVIFHLESFDALLVRSSITNHLVGRAASEYAPSVFSGEGADELFAGYDYLKSLDPQLLTDELISITAALHNTALQRVDRSASAFGSIANVCFLDPDVVDYALRIPFHLKLHDGVEKWILRRAMASKLPERVLNRRKAKFWEGTGLGDLLAGYAESRIPEEEFRRERNLDNGWTLNTKEELMYYRIFQDIFGTVTDLSWMGRTKGAPCAPVY